MKAGDTVIVLLSGGGSALLELPKAGIRMQDLRRVNQDLLLSGASIQQINKVRKSMSLIKAGGLAHMAAPARVVTLILSDVVGDDLGVIASGPTVPQLFEPADARSVLEEYGLWQLYPEGLQQAIMIPPDRPSDIPEPENILLANNHTIQKAASDSASQLGFTVEHADQPLTGEARLAGKAFAKKLRAADKKYFCLIQGGETTVTVHGDGVGGRNQEFAVAAGQMLEPADRIAIACFATDGIDGPTDAAGAIVTSEFKARAHALGLDPQKQLASNDVYPLLDHMGCLIHTGPTQTNLNDIAVGFSYSTR
jgi:hydroxypyruvate reductase